LEPVAQRAVGSSRCVKARRPRSTGSPTSDHDITDQRAGATSAKLPAE